MRKEFKYLTAVSMIFSLAVIAWSGFRMPWNEQAVLYAIYGGAIGFYVAIALSMFIVWKIDPKNRKQK